MEEHLLPMMVVSDRSSGEIITQVFNFVEYFPTKQQITADNAEKLLKLRGILENSSASSKLFDSKKEEQEYQLAVGSSYIQDQLNTDELVTLNEFLEESEKVNELVLDPRTVNYKELILTTFKSVNDPFNNQIVDINFDQNPNDTTQMQMNVQFTKDQQKQ